MTEPPRRSNWLTNGWITTAIALAALVYGAGVWTSQNTGQSNKSATETADNTRRITALESRDTTRGDALARIDSRTARIEATLEMMTGRKEYRPLSEPALP